MTSPAENGKDLLTVILERQQLILEALSVLTDSVNEGFEEVHEKLHNLSLEDDGFSVEES